MANKIDSIIWYLAQALWGGGGIKFVLFTFVGLRLYKIVNF